MSRGSVEVLWELFGVPVSGWGDQREKVGGF